MALYLLDKNVVEDIHASLAGEQSKHIREAREIDRPNNIVSPILAIMEGSSQLPQTAAQMTASLKKDADAVKKFYTNARTDAHALLNPELDMVSAFAPHMRKKAGDLMPFVRIVQPLLARTYSIADARDIRSNIDKTAKSFSLPLAHPLVTCALSCLYNHDAARKVLKPTLNPTDESAYNAVADIRILMDVAYIRDLWNANQQSHMPVRLHSRDKKLNQLDKLLKISAQGGNRLRGAKGDLELIQFTATRSPELFPSAHATPTRPTTQHIDELMTYLVETRGS
ncbi:hypothetical protein LXM60_00660 [Pandoraea sputorum]|uniref:hypothetical protein n=1 Tax=Pandoraea sputorum TaxID=93222 RepID=UPI001E4F4351|nr:hypothetical protein [Pandoraea sputorum]MCE4058719.1 hypothetical protein [Pandoraea sputorum]